MERGIIDVYLMFDEPRTEIDPGLGFMLKKKFSALEFNKQKQTSIYTFNSQNRHKKNGCYIASNNNELAEQIIHLI